MSAEQRIEDNLATSNQKRKKRRNRKKQRKRRQNKKSPNVDQPETEHNQSPSNQPMEAPADGTPSRSGALSAPPILREQNLFAFPPPSFPHSFFGDDHYLDNFPEQNIVRERYSPANDSPPPDRRKLPRNLPSNDDMGNLTQPIARRAPSVSSLEDISAAQEAQYNENSSDSELNSSMDDLSMLLQQSVALNNSYQSFDKIPDFLENSPKMSRRDHDPDHFHESKLLPSIKPNHIDPSMNDFQSPLGYNVGYNNHQRSEVMTGAPFNMRSYDHQGYDQGGYSMPNAAPVQRRRPLYESPSYYPSGQDMQRNPEVNSLYAHGEDPYYPMHNMMPVMQGNSPMMQPHPQSGYPDSSRSHAGLSGYYHQPSSPRHPTNAPSHNVGTVPCRYFLQGYCSRGQKCSFSHVASGEMNNPYYVDKKVRTHRRSHSAGFPRREMYNNSINYNTINKNAPALLGGHQTDDRHLVMNPPTPDNPVMMNPSLRESLTTPNRMLALDPNIVAAVAPGATVQNDDGTNNFLDLNLNLNLKIEQFIGQIYPMCKDQFGCRFLQKKLDEEQSKKMNGGISIPDEGLSRFGVNGLAAPELTNPTDSIDSTPTGNLGDSTGSTDSEPESSTKIVDIIFTEVYPHFGELMMDPFGNYLCQKLLEYCSDEQRFKIIESVSSSLSVISQNMHGTRAVQKMIECLNNDNVKEIKLVTSGLSYSVVLLIKDLNGNHVIQRCLNHLDPHYNQFIYDAVAGHCIEVATHRHGCCVLQRCIDHANEKQKVQLVSEIAFSALTLVKDPYGNYVVQYVLDLPFPNLIAQLVSKLAGHLVELSTQKFSSNVVEKCLMVGNAATRSWMIVELIESGQLEMLIQDPFGNYVIQTAMTISDPAQSQRLIEGIKPHLHTLRNTPYGKRIQNKIMKTNNRRRHK